MLRKWRLKVFRLFTWWFKQKAKHGDLASDGMQKNSNDKLPKTIISQNKQVPPHSNAQNAYLEAIEAHKWNSLHAYHIEREATWRLIAIFAMVLAIIISLYSIYMVSLDRHKTLIFKQDSQDNLSLLGIATTTFKVDNKIIAHQLANFITCLRGVPQDLALKREHIAVVHKMISSDIQKQVDQLIIGQYQKLKNNESVLIKFTSLEPLPGNGSWEVHWQEQNSLSGAITNWSAVITFKLMKQVPINIQLVNPIGLIITYLNVVEDINDNAK
jgi:type IV secretory pathway TrbF-like protein